VIILIIISTIYSGITYYYKKYGINRNDEEEQKKQIINTIKQYEKEILEGYTSMEEYKAVFEKVAPTNELVQLYDLCSKLLSSIFEFKKIIQDSYDSEDHVIENPSLVFKKYIVIFKQLRMLMIFLLEDESCSKLLNILDERIKGPKFEIFVRNFSLKIFQFYQKVNKHI
jgi:hypothetical protein